MALRAIAVTKLHIGHLELHLGDSKRHIGRTKLHIGNLKLHIGDLELPVRTTAPPLYIAFLLYFLCLFRIHG